MIRKMIDALTWIGIDRLARNAFAQREAERAEYERGRAEGMSDAIEYGTRRDDSRDYQRGLAAGRADERAKVRWLEGCEAMDLLLHIGRGHLVWQDSAGDPCIRPGVRVGVVVEEKDHD